MIHALLFLDAAGLGLSIAWKNNCSSHAIEIDHLVVELEMTQCYVEGTWYSSKKHEACPVSLPTSLNSCVVGSQMKSVIEYSAGLFNGL